MKQFFANMKERLSKLRITGFFKNLFNKMKESKVVTDVQAAEAGYDEFNKSHNNVKDSIAGNVMHRIQQAIKAAKKKFRKNHKNNEPTVMGKIMSVIIKVVCIALTVAFAALVIYAIKDVFLYCLQLVALCAATVICIEFILWVLSTAFGCKI